MTAKLNEQTAVTLAPLTAEAAAKLKLKDIVCLIRDPAIHGTVHELGYDYRRRVSAIAIIWDDQKSLGAQWLDVRDCSIISKL